MFHELLSGPGILKGVVLPHMTGNIDIMRTIPDIAGGPNAVPDFVDGKSMLPLLLPAVAAARGFQNSNETWYDVGIILTRLSTLAPTSTRCHCAVPYGLHGAASMFGR